MSGCAWTSCTSAKYRYSMTSNCLLERCQLCFGARPAVDVQLQSSWIVNGFGHERKILSTPAGFGVVCETTIPDAEGRRLGDGEGRGGFAKSWWESLCRRLRDLDVSPRCGTRARRFGTYIKRDAKAIATTA